MTTSSDSTAERFAALCARIASSPAPRGAGGQVFEAEGGVPDTPSLSLILQSLYHHPPRAYHSLEHIAACVDTLDHWRHLAVEPDLVEFALLLHDCIYDPRARDNEARSADIAALFLRALGAPAAIDTVRALILATRHTGEPLAGDEALTADIDMSILGAAPPDYDAYARAVRAEYASVPESEYRAGRSRFLRALLARQHIFHTPALRGTLEPAGRANAERELAAL